MIKRKSEIDWRREYRRVTDMFCFAIGYFIIGSFVIGILTLSPSVMPWWIRLLFFDVFGLMLIIMIGLVGRRRKA
jgi:hypothetical protein